MPELRANRWRELLIGRRTIAATKLGLAFGINSLPFYTAGLFITSLHEERGWNLVSLSLGPTLLVAIMAATAPFMGIAFDRFGERRFILPGLLAQAAGFFLLSKIDSLAAYWTIIASMALLGAGCSTPAYLRIVNRTFDSAKGTALGLTITGAALFGAVIPPLLQMIISQYDWRTGYVGLAMLVLAATPAILLLLGPSAVPAKPAANTPGRSTFRYSDLVASPIFVFLSLEVIAVSLACSGLVIHFAPMARQAGVGAQEAAWLISVIGMTQMISRLATGTLIDRFFAPRVAAVIMIAGGAGIAVFGWGGIALALIGAMAVGLAYGAEADIVGYFVGRYFPADHFGRIFGALYAVSLAATALSPSLYGIVADRFGSYRFALFGAAVLLAIAALLLLRLPPFPEGKGATECLKS